MYCAQTESGSGDFTSLAIRNKRLEFRFNSGSGTANIQSEPITEGEWIKVNEQKRELNYSVTVCGQYDMFITFIEVSQSSGYDDNELKLFDE